MKPEDFGITKYTVLASGHLEITQHVDMKNFKLEEFPFKVERINGHLDLSHNQLLNINNLLFPVMGNIKLNHNHIKDVDNFIRYHKNKYCDFYDNKIEEIKIAGELNKEFYLNIVKNPIKKISFTEPYCDGRINFENITDFSTFPKYINCIHAGNMVLDNFSNFPKFQSLSLYKSKVESFKHMDTTVQDLNFIKCFLKNLEDLPYNVKHHIRFIHCEIENFNYKFSTDNLKEFIQISHQCQDTLIDQSDDYTNLEKYFDNYDVFKNIVKKTIIMKNL